ncbi:thiamine phosphate synthase [Verrucomicrobia bacterium]|nr:thiamine phosphate synthase [Verrucomicrobiota bacterium]MDB4664936.1 thiamine phosphate synthase [Verrucomicrobiota bacterium]MDG1890921.1 thiamine phosphate synthase [Verrucomicrobiota bacterium]
MKPLEQCRLYAFIDEAYRHSRPVEDLAKSLCDGGADIIQLRMKGAPTNEILQAAERVYPITETAGVHLVINDHLEVAKKMPSSFLHLGQEDFFDQGNKHVSELAPHVKHTDLKVGLSTHAPNQATRAIRAGAAYIAIGPIFATPTKPDAKPVTLKYIQWANANVTLPWFAIGGIHRDNVDAILEAGAQRICVVSSILKAVRVDEACRFFRKKVDHGSRPPCHTHPDSDPSVPNRTQ